MLESVLEKHLKDALDKLKIDHIKGNSRGLKGYPDKLVFAHQIFFVELKVGKEGGSYYKQQPMQKYWQRIIEKAGGTYLLLVGLQQVDEFIEMIKNNIKDPN